MNCVDYGKNFRLNSNINATLILKANDIEVHNAKRGNDKFFLNNFYSCQYIKKQVNYREPHYWRASHVQTVGVAGGMFAPLLTYSPRPTSQRQLVTLHSYNHRL